LAFLKMQMPGMAAIAFCFVMAFVVVKSNETVDALSYLAVLQDSDQTPQVVAVTYGNSKKLALDIMALPNIDSQQSYELWVTSKTDKQARSLGQIPKNLANFQIQLSEAQWRLIVDSADLLISVEELGGSAIGEPSELIVSRGLCIRLSGWQNDA
jgi:anti-sigma-K factor RskA